MVDRREPGKLKHDLLTLLRERLFYIAAGYADANDLDTLKQDPALKIACQRRSKTDPDRASQPRISRLENRVTTKDLLGMGLTLAPCIIDPLPSDTKRLILDVDAT